MFVIADHTGDLGPGPEAFQCGGEVGRIWLADGESVSADYGIEKMIKAEQGEHFVGHPLRLVGAIPRRKPFVFSFVSVSGTSG